VDSSGNVYIADTSNNRIDIFNPRNFAGTFISYGTSGGGDGQFSLPYDVAVSSSRIYVADALNNRMVQLSEAASTPEPSSLLLGGLGLALAGVYCRAGRVA